MLVSALVFSLAVALPAFAADSSPIAPTPTQTAEEAEGEGTGTPVIAEPGPPASYYASYGLIAIGGLTVLAVLAGYLFQAPGFRRSSKGASS